MRVWNVWAATVVGTHVKGGSTSWSISQRVNLAYISLYCIFSMRKYLPQVGFPIFT